MNKRVTAIVMTAIVTVSCLTLGSGKAARAAVKDKRQEIISKLQEVSGSSFKIRAEKKNGNYTFVSGKLSSKKLAGTGEALKFLDENKELFGLSGTNNLKMLETSKDSLGYTRVKFAQLIDGEEVKDREVSVYFDNTGVVSNVVGNLETDALKVTKLGGKELTADEAVKLAASKFNFKELRKSPETQKLIMVEDGKAYQVFKVNIQYNEPEIGNWDVYVEAFSGNILKQESRIRMDGAVTGTGTAVDGSAKSLNLYLSGSTYQLKDITKPMTGQILTYTANNRQTQPGTLITSTSATINDKAGVSAHYFAGVVYDFYNNLFSRNSIDSAGMSIISTAHYGSNYNNAFWDGTQMVYGDGDGSTFIPLSGDLDVVGHEMTHGVTERTSNLNYSNESGALNESMSDVFGVLIETYDKYNVRNGGTWSFNSGDWLVGDEVYTPSVAGDALRSLENPTLFNQPDNMSGYVNTTSDNGGVHTNSGIPNKAAYLVANSVGLEKTAQIYYRALTTYFTPTTDFAGARDGLVQAATDLFGAGSPEATAVGNAYTSVGIAATQTLQDSFEPNNSAAAAYSIASGTIYNALIASASDVDYYKVNKTSSGYITISLTNLPKDYDVYLINSSGNTVAKSVNAGTSSEAISYRTNKTGTYYIKIVGYNGAYSTSQQYALKVTY